MRRLLSPLARTVGLATPVDAQSHARTVYAARLVGSPAG
jgi:hypothetical protein